MLAKMLQRVNGAYGTIDAGAVVELPAAVALAWADAGIAELEQPAPVERAEAAQPGAETAAIEPPSYAAFTRERRQRKPRP